MMSPTSRPVSQINRLREHKNSLLLLFLVALLVRLVYLFEISQTTAFDILLGDAAGYDLWARQIADGNWLGDRVFYQSPLYPYLLGIIYAIFGRTILLVRLAKLFLGALTCVLLAIAGERFFDKKTGLFGGFLLAVYPAAVFFDGSMQKTSIGVFFMTLFVLLLGKINHRARRRLWFFSGLTLGCLGLVRENSLLLCPLVFLWLLIHFKNEPVKRRFVWLSCFLTGLLIVLLPVGIRNKIVGHDFVLTTAQLGTNFYIGNNRTADGMYRSLTWSRGHWGFESADASRLAEQETGQHLNAARVSAFWLQKTLAEIGSDPLSWIHLMLKKWGLLWNAVEVGDTESQYAHDDWSRLLNFLGKLFHFGILFPIAAAGLWLTRKQWRQLWILYLLLLGYAVSVWLFYIFARYRMPMIPLLIMFASAGLMQCISLFQHKNPGGFIPLLGIVLVSAVFVNQKKIPPAHFAATTYSNLGVCLEETRPDKARMYYRKAVRLNPDFVKAYYKLGRFLMRRREFNNAINAFTRALTVNPNNEEIHFHLGLSYLATGRPDVAFYHFQQTVRINPGFAPVVYYKMAVARATQNQWDQSSALLNKAVLMGFTETGRINDENALGPAEKEKLLQMFAQTIHQE